MFDKKKTWKLQNDIQFGKLINDDFWIQAIFNCYNEISLVVGREILETISLRPNELFLLVLNVP